MLGANRDVIAKRFFFHVVTVYRISPGTASAADIDVFALAAFPFIGFEVAQVAEDFRIFPDFTEGRLFDVAGGTVEIGTGLDIAKAVNQADCLCGYASFATSGGECQ